MRCVYICTNPDVQLTARLRLVDIFVHVKNGQYFPDMRCAVCNYQARNIDSRDTAYTPEIVCIMLEINMIVSNK